MPSARKMDAPRYGTHPGGSIPVVTVPDNVSARVLAGTVAGVTGPFQTTQPLQMVDFTLAPGATLTHEVPAGLDNVLLFAFKGEGTLVLDAPAAPVALPPLHVARLAATDAARRAFVLTAGAAGASVMLFAGKRLDQPVAWHGPFVMTTDAEITQTIADYRRGAFPPVRVPWDYRRLASFPPKNQPL